MISEVMVTLLSGKRRSKSSLENITRHLGVNNTNGKPKKTSKSISKKQKGEHRMGNEGNADQNNKDLKVASASQQMAFFLDEFQSNNNIQLSSLELESISDTQFLELSQGIDQDSSILCKSLKVSAGPLWKEMLCERQIVKRKVEPGSPTVLIICASALRSLELLRGLRPLTKECPPAKLFSKHMRVDEQVFLLKDHTNIAAGTPSRIKKLIDMEALGLSRLSIIVLDMHMDVKGYSLITLPQVRDEFWELYKSYFHDLLVGGKVRISLYDWIPVGSSRKQKPEAV